MTTQVKGFIEIADLIDNAQGAVAGIGELSDYSRTYSTDKRNYSLDAYPGIDLIVFDAKKDTVRSLITAATKTKILEVANNLVENLTNTGTAAEFLNTAHPELANVATSATIEVGGKYYIQSLSFNYDDNGEDTQVELWFADSVFRTEYSSYEIRVSPPLAQINNLYDTFVNAQNAINGVTIPEMLATKEQVRNGTSPTEERHYELRWTDPNDPANTFITYWTILCYAPNATVSENILEEIRNYLANNSSYTVEQWRTYFPEILTLENFTIIPLWDNVAKEVGNNITPLYSPVTKLRELETKVLKVLPDRTTSEIETNGETMIHVWNSILMFAIAGAGNPTDRNAFTKVYPDYVALSFGDQNLSQISQGTQDVIQAIELLLTLGENYTPGSITLPTGVSEYESSTRTYLEKTVNGMVIRVMTKNTYMTVINA